MLNQDKYKTPEERNHAFNEWCFSRDCESCKIEARKFRKAMRKAAMFGKTHDKRKTKRCGRGRP